MHPSIFEFRINKLKSALKGKDLFCSDTNYSAVLSKLTNLENLTREVFDKWEVPYVNSIFKFAHREELTGVKKSTCHIQREYFEFLKKYFWHHFERMSKGGMNPHTYAQAIAGTEKYRTIVLVDVERILFENALFWSIYEDRVTELLEKSKSVKSFYSGDIFFSYSKRITSHVSYFVDTIIVQDPVQRVNIQLLTFSEENIVYYLIKHALNLLQYEVLCTADIDPPVICLVPEVNDSNPEFFKWAPEQAEFDKTKHFEMLFDRKFESKEALQDFFSKVSDVDQLEKKIKNPTYFNWDVSESELSIREKVERAFEFSRNLSNEKMTIPAGNIKELLDSSFGGRYLQVIDALSKAAYYNASPLFEAPTPWKYYLWKMQFGSKELAKKIDQKGAHLVNAIVNLKEFKFIAEISDATLLRIRREKQIGRIRLEFQSKFLELSQSEASDYEKVCLQISKHIRSEVDKYNSKLEEIHRKESGHSDSISKLLITGTCSIAAAYFGTKDLAILTAVTGFTLGSPGFQDIIRDKKELKVIKKELEKSTVGILMMDGASRYNGLNI